MSIPRGIAIALLLCAVPVVHGRARAAENAWDAAVLLRFFDDHPWVARDLRREPALANDTRYLEEHRSLREFLARHSDVRRALDADPYAALRRAQRLERTARARREIDPDELERLDRFLHDHPEVRRDLHANPALVNDRAYLARHPSLRDFLRGHPAIRREFQENPWVFMRRRERGAQGSRRQGPPPSPRP